MLLAVTEEKLIDCGRFTIAATSNWRISFAWTGIGSTPSGAELDSGQSDHATQSNCFTVAKQTFRPSRDGSGKPLPFM